MVDTKLVVNEAEADQVRQIFALYLERLSLINTVKELNRRGWATKNWVTRKGTHRGGRPFTKNNLYQLLTNVTYIGQLKYKDEVHDGEQEAIVDDVTFKQVQAALRQNGRSGGAGVRNKHGALLRGLLRCATCDCSMAHTYTTKGQRRYNYYVCRRAQQQGWSVCPSPSVPAVEIERFVIDEIKCIGRDPAVVAETLAQTSRQTDTSAERLESEQRNLNRLIRDSHVELRELVSAPIGEGDRAARLADIQDRVRIAERRVTEIKEEVVGLQRETFDEQDVAAALADFDGVWDSLIPRERARILELLIECIDYDGESETISITFHPTGIKTLAAKLENDKEDAA